MSARLSDLRVSGLRCLDGLHLTLQPLTALIGANGAGKSSTIQALQFLFGAADLQDHDCSDGITDTEISVTGTFTDLPPSWADQLRPWLDDNNDLVLTRSRTIDGEGRVRQTYSATRRQTAGFAPIRTAIAQGKLVGELKELWRTAQDATSGRLPNWPNKGPALETLDEYERANSESLTETSSDSTLGFLPGSGIDLTEMVELLVLPALRDASSDATDSRGSTLTRLVDLTVRSGMNLDQKLADLTEQTSRAYQQIVDDAGGTGLDDLSALITDQLNSFAPGSRVALRWEPRMPTLAPPPVKATIIESGHEADVGRQGHGVQRAYVFSLLRALLEARRADGLVRPGLVLAVEEPEVYQHPIRARYVANVLIGLAHATDSTTQVIYTTHSPLFVSVEHIESVRQLRLTATTDDSQSDSEGGATYQTEADREPDTGPDQPELPIASDDTASPVDLEGAGDTESANIPADADSGAEQGSTPGPARPRTRATAPTLNGIATRLEIARAGRGQPWTSMRVAAQLPGLLGTAVSEGFFADKVVLVEGEEDFGFIHGAAEASGFDLYEDGVAVIAVGGKDRLLLAHEVFHAAAVPTYVVYDTDVAPTGAADPGSLMLNHIISGLVGETPDERPATRVATSSAPMNPSLRPVIEAEIGSHNVEAAFTTTLDAMGLGPPARKNGYLVRAVTLRLYAQGHRSETLDALVREIRQ